MISTLLTIRNIFLKWLDEFSGLDRYVTCGQSVRCIRSCHSQCGDQTSLITRLTKMGHEEKRGTEGEERAKRKKSRDLNQKAGTDSAINLLSALPNCLAVAAKADFLSSSFL